MRTRSLMVIALLVGPGVVVGMLGPWSPIWGSPAVILGSTTTTQDTGLLDVLQHAYRTQTGIPLRIVVAGTGAILQQGRNGDLDVLLTHDSGRERTFVEEGHGLWRRPVMYNDFVFVGPPLADWAPSDAIANLATNATAFLAALYAHRAEVTFVSRGDDSGTHSREIALWAAAGIARENLSGSWYKQTGSGQAETLRVAIELRAYALSDEATWKRLSSEGQTVDLEVVVRDPPRMRNQYGVIPTSRLIHPRANEVAGIAFALWLTGSAGQAVIGGYRVAGEAAFYPNADDPFA